MNDSCSQAIDIFDKIIVVQITRDCIYAHSLIKHNNVYFIPLICMYNIILII